MNATNPIDVPLDYSTTDPTAWAAAYLRALAEYPEQVGSAEGTASWFAATMEVGRRADAFSEQEHEGFGWDRDDTHEVEP